MKAQQGLAPRQAMEGLGVRRSAALQTLDLPSGPHLPPPPETRSPSERRGRPWHGGARQAKVQFPDEDESKCSSSTERILY
jgi:hypothetical protein